MNLALARFKVPCEVFRHSLKLLQGRGLAPEHVGHGLELETDIQGAEVWRVEGAVVLEFAGARFCSRTSTWGSPTSRPYSNNNNNNFIKNLLHLKNSTYDYYTVLSSSILLSEKK